MLLQSAQIKEEGFLALYRGLTPVLLRAFPANAVSPSPFILLYYFCLFNVTGVFPWLRDSNESVELFVPIIIVTNLLPLVVVMNHIAPVYKLFILLFTPYSYMVYIVGHYYSVIM